jgi:hypothetical protein
MKILAALVVMLFPLHVLADGPELGDDCTLTWDAPLTGPTPRGYIVRWAPTSGGPVDTFDVGNVLTAQCSAIGITQVGQYYATVRAYNNLGESGDSNEVPFLFSVPATSGNLTAGP